MCFYKNLARVLVLFTIETSGVIATAEVLVTGLERIGVGEPDPCPVWIKDSPNLFRVLPRRRKKTWSPSAPRK